LAGQRACKELERALRALDRAVKCKHLPSFHLPWDLEIFREASFSIPTEELTWLNVDYEQWIAYWINLARYAAAEPVPKKPGRFEPAKRVAAEVAAELLIRHGLELTSSRAPNNVFLNLAATIHGEHLAPKRFLQHCLAVQNALLKAHDRLGHIKPKRPKQRAE
jgi:hypothetical protein